MHVEFAVVFVSFNEWIECRTKDKGDGKAFDSMPLNLAYLSQFRYLRELSEPQRFFSFQFDSVTAPLRIVSAMLISIAGVCLALRFLAHAAPHLHCAANGEWSAARERLCSVYVLPLLG